MPCPPPNLKSWANTGILECWCLYLSSISSGFMVETTTLLGIYVGEWNQTPGFCFTVVREADLTPPSTMNWLPPARVFSSKAEYMRPCVESLRLASPSILAE